MTTLQTDKLRYIYLGHSIRGKDMYTLLESDLSPEHILNRNLRNLLTEASFTPDPTNWNGVDDISRICKLKGFKPKDHIPLNSTLTFHGTDYDHGHEYSWSVEINMIATVEPI